MFTYVVLIHSNPNNMNSIVYQLILVKYSMKTLHWYFPWATALHFYNMTGTGGKLQQLHCYHPFSDSLDIYLTKNHYENYSPKMVPIAKIWGSGSWTNSVSDGKWLNILIGVKIICSTLQGLNSLKRRRLTGIGIPIINLRRSDDRLRFIMGIPILIRRRLLSE